MDGRVQGVVVQHIEGVRPLHLEPDGHGRILDIRVALIRFEIRKRRGAARTVRHNAVSLVDQLLFPEGLEYPPDGLHEGRIHGLVIVIEIDPPPHPRHHLAPFTGVAQDNTAAALVEHVHAQSLNVALAAELQILFDFIFNG